MSIPALVPTLLALGVLLVNGWTDAPNAIATAVSTGALSFRRAAALAAACNLLGCLAASALSGAVAATVFDLADFGGGEQALTALCAAMSAVILWGGAAWCFGLPTSESHALLSGLSGAAVALRGDLSCLRPLPWWKALLGLALSLVLGFLFSRLLAERLPAGGRHYRALQAAGAGLMALAHGAQDGQKFLGILLLAQALSPTGPLSGEKVIPLTILSAVGMALGTALGGRRITDTMGRKLTHLTPRTGFAADLGGGLCLLLLTLLGAPVSTTHAKAAAIAGAGSVEGGTDQGTAVSLSLAWLLTFPACAALAYGITRVLCP